MVKKTFIVVSCLTIFFDQLAKLIVKGTGNYSVNTGALFGLFKGTNYLLVALSLIYLAFITFYYKKLPKNKYAQIFFALITGGLIANTLDRILLGGVIDFINLGFWPSFNIADAAVTTGVIGLIACYLKK